MTEASISLLAGIFGACQCRGFFDCNLPIDSYGGVFVWLLLMAYMLRTLSNICDDYFVPSLESIVDKLHVPNDVASVTFIALGSSAPRLCVVLISTFLLVNASGVGVIVGSGIFNVLAIVGMTGRIACGERHSVRIWWYPLLRDSAFYLLALLELLLILADETVEWYEGLVLLLTYGLYGLCMRLGTRLTQRMAQRRLQAAAKRAQDAGEADFEATATAEAGGGTEAAPEGAPEGAGGEPGGTHTPGGTYAPSGTDSPERARSPERTSSRHGSRGGSAPSGGAASAAGADGPGAAAEEPAPEVTLFAPPAAASEEEGEPPPLAAMLRDPLAWALEAAMPAKRRRWLLLGLSLLCVAAATYVAADSADRAGRILNLPPVATGLTVLAVGTTIPDALGSIAVARQGEGDLAVANALGAGVFDVVVGLGVPWTLRCISGGSITFKGEFESLKWDVILLMSFVALVLFMIVNNKHRLTRRGAGFLQALYAVYCVFTFVGLFTLRSQN